MAYAVGRQTSFGVGRLRKYGRLPIAWARVYGYTHLSFRRLTAAGDTCRLG